MPGRGLEGFRIIECGEMVAAAYATRLMADLGAEVIKIERPQGGDVARQRGPFPGKIPHPEKSGLFLYLNVNKRGVTLDLEQPRSQRRVVVLRQRLHLRPTRRLEGNRGGSLPRSLVPAQTSRARVSLLQ